MLIRVNKFSEYTETGLFPAVSSVVSLLKISESLML